MDNTNMLCLTPFVLLNITLQTEIKVHAISKYV